MSFSPQVAFTTDSHGSLDRLDILLSNLQKAQIKYLLHAGDFASGNIVEILVNYPRIKMFFARGNADVNMELLRQINNLPHCEVGEVAQAEIFGLKFALSHIEGVAQNLVRDANIYGHGHTHRSKVANRNGKLILNPGALCEDGKYFLLDLKNPKIKPWLFSDLIK